MINKNIVLAGVGFLAVTGFILSSNQKVKKNIGSQSLATRYGVGSLDGAVLDGGKTTTTTTTTTSIPSKNNYDLSKLSEAPSYQTTSTKKSVNSSNKIRGTSVKGGVEFRNSSGKLVAVQDDVKKQSRIPTKGESAFNRAIINKPKKQTTTKQPPSTFNAIFHPIHTIRGFF